MFTGELAPSLYLFCVNFGLVASAQPHRHTKQGLANSTSSCKRLARGSVVWASVFGWRTFTDLCLIYGWHVTTSWIRCPLWVNQPGQLSLSSLRGR